MIRCIRCCCRLLLSSHIESNDSSSLNGSLKLHPGNWGGAKKNKKNKGPYRNACLSGGSQPSACLLEYTQPNTYIIEDSDLMSCFSIRLKSRFQWGDIQKYTAIFFFFLQTSALWSLVWLFLLLLLIYFGKTYGSSEINLCHALVWLNNKICCF